MESLKSTPQHAELLDLGTSMRKAWRKLNPSGLGSEPRSTYFSIAEAPDGPTFDYELAEITINIENREDDRRPYGGLCFTGNNRKPRYQQTPGVKNLLVARLCVEVGEDDIEFGRFETMPPTDKPDAIPTPAIYHKETQISLDERAGLFIAHLGLIALCERQG